MFPELNIETNYEMLNHDQTCNYNPYMEEVAEYLPKYSKEEEHKNMNLASDDQPKENERKEDL
jgi:hypothetical protein